MSAGPTKGGVTIKVLTGRSAADLLTYRDKVDEGQESHVFDATRHCSHDVGTQIAEWQDVRITHGTDGKMKTTRARYETVDPETGLHANGQRGTHVRYWDEKSNRWRKRLAGTDETPTHLRFEPRTPLEKESEATHTIYAFGRDMVNPNNPEDIDRAFQAVKAERDELYPGLQESMWLEKNGKSGLVHVHVASNATIYEDFTHGGRDYVAGKKMAGGIVNVDAVRASFENYLDEHPEYGFEQSLARVGTKEYTAAQRRSSQKDYWDQTRGKESNHDRMRRVARESLEDPAVTDRDSFITEMKTRGITVTETGLRRGVAGKNHDYTYRLVGAKKGDHGARGTTLGNMYSYDAIGAQLDLKAVGQEIEADVPQHVGEAKPLPFEKQPLSRAEQKELADLTESIKDLADAEKALQTVEEERQQKAEAAVEALKQSVLQSFVASRPDNGQDRSEALRIRRAEKLAEAQRASQEAWASIGAHQTKYEAQQAAERAKREETLSNPVGRFEGMDRDEITHAVDEHVLVHTEWFGGASGMVRTPDTKAMRDSGLLTNDEVKYLDDAWWALERPVTRGEREGQTSPFAAASVETPSDSAAEPSDDIAQPDTYTSDTAQDGVTEGATLCDTVSEEMTSSSAPAPARAIEPKPQIDLSSRWNEYPTEMRQVSSDIERSVRQYYPDWDKAQVDDAVQQGLVYNAKDGRLDQILVKRREINEREAAEAQQAQISSSAPAPVETAPDSAAASSVPTPAPWQSRLRDVDTTGRSEKIRVRIEGVAALDERWHGSMPQTDEERQAFEKEVKAAGGVAGSFLQDHGDRLSPDVREELTRRAESREAREKDRKRYLEEADAAKEREATFRSPDIAQKDPIYREHAKKANTAAERYQETTEQIARGDYSRSDRDREQKAHRDEIKRESRARDKANQERRAKEQNQQDEGLSL